MVFLADLYIEQMDVLCTSYGEMNRSTLLPSKLTLKASIRLSISTELIICSFQAQ